MHAYCPELGASEHHIFDSSWQSLASLFWKKPCKRPNVFPLTEALCFLLPGLPGVTLASLASILRVSTRLSSLFVSRQEGTELFGPARSFESSSPKGPCIPRPSLWTLYHATRTKHTDTHTKTQTQTQTHTQADAHTHARTHVHTRPTSQPNTGDQPASQTQATNQPAKHSRPTSQPNTGLLAPRRRLCRRGAGLPAPAGRSAQGARGRENMYIYIYNTCIES